MSLMNLCLTCPSLVVAAAPRVLVACLQACADVSASVRGAAIPCNEAFRTALLSQPSSIDTRGSLDADSDGTVPSTPSQIPSLVQTLCEQIAIPNSHLRLCCLTWLEALHSSPSVSLVPLLTTVLPALFAPLTQSVYTGTGSEGQTPHPTQPEGEGEGERERDNPSSTSSPPTLSSLSLSSQRDAILHLSTSLLGSLAGSVAHQDVGAVLVLGRRLASRDSPSSTSACTTQSLMLAQRVFTAHTHHKSALTEIPLYVPIVCRHKSGDPSVAEAADALGSCLASILDSTSGVQGQSLAAEVAQAVVPILSGDGFVLTREAALRWVRLCLSRVKGTPHMNSTLGKVFKPVSALFRDPSESIARSAVTVLCEACIPLSEATETEGDGERREAAGVCDRSDGTVYAAFYGQVADRMVSVLLGDRAYLDLRGSVMLRQFGSASASSLGAILLLARTICKRQKKRLVNRVVRCLCSCLLTAPEYADVRLGLRQDAHSMVSLISAFSVDPVSLMSLLLLAGRYASVVQLVEEMVTRPLDAETLTDLDQLVCMLETPVYARLRVDLARPVRHAPLVRALYCILALLPQTKAYTTLSRRLSHLSPLILLSQMGSPVPSGTDGYTHPDPCPPDTHIHSDIPPCDGSMVSEPHPCEGTVGVESRPMTSVAVSDTSKDIGVDLEEEGAVGMVQEGPATGLDVFSLDTTLQDSHSTTHSLE
ncbi:vacuole morphology and inheritance protein 14 [Kipferlia bialata]|uniref:Vacuole morphology and inheritance protein 14 n=1 Tax=Kipferlia bialata TaxID=797122 RepID=A0A9K3CY76_9EUKA|nr:vacuole morphology and inheritance protein 14 [Kipferlia bialata]|eukprot:g6001.t1